MTSRPRQWHLILLLGAVLVASYTWPLLPRLDRIGRADTPDGQYALWQATWVARAIVTDPLHVYDANIFYPHRSTLAFSEPSLLAGVMGVPAYVATKSPYATHNLAVLGYFLLSFVSAYALGRYVTGEGLPAVACGVAYTFSPFMFARTAQLPMLGTFGLPLCLLALHRFVDAPSLGTAAAIGGALCLQALSCGYYTVFAVLIVGLGMIYFGAAGRTLALCAVLAFRRGSRGNFNRALPAGVLAAPPAGAGAGILAADVGGGPVFSRLAGVVRVLRVGPPVDAAAARHLE